MICKLTAYGEDRDAAIKTSIEALDSYVIRGVTHNIPLLRDILDEPTFLSGTFTTNYLNEVYPEGFKGANINEKELTIYFPLPLHITFRTNYDYKTGQLYLGV